MLHVSRRGRSDLFAEVTAHNMQGHVDARSESARGRNAAMIDEPESADQLHLRKLPFKAVPEIMMSGCSHPVEQAEFGKFEGACADRQKALEDVKEADTLLVAGGLGYRAAAADQQLIEWLRKSGAGAARLGSICTGSLILAAAGLLDGRRATTHWAYGRELEQSAPSSEVEPDAIFVRDGRVYTSAGVTAGMDLALAMVEEDWGRSVALAVAQELVLYLKRPGGQSQFSRLLEAQRHDDRFGSLEAWVIENLTENLTVPALAERLGMSVRQFSRRFKQEMQTPPARFVEQLRVECARANLTDGKRNLKAIARQCGFGDEQRMRRAFRKHLGVTPVEYQQRFC